jgi:hypothetical protein
MQLIVVYNANVRIAIRQRTSCSFLYNTGSLMMAIKRSRNM